MLQTVACSAKYNYPFRENDESLPMISAEIDTKHFEDDDDDVWNCLNYKRNLIDDSGATTRRARLCKPDYVLK